MGKPVGKGTKTYKDNITGEETDKEGYWAGGKFFEGDPPEGVLEQQMDFLKNAREAYKEQMRLQREEELKALEAEKGGKKKKKKKTGL